MHSKPVQQVFMVIFLNFAQNPVVWGFKAEALVEMHVIGNATTQINLATEGDRLP